VAERSGDTAFERMKQVGNIDSPRPLKSAVATGVLPALHEVAVVRAVSGKIYNRVDQWIIKPEAPAITTTKLDCGGRAERRHRFRTHETVWKHRQPSSAQKRRRHWRSAGALHEVAVVRAVSGKI